MRTVLLTHVTQYCGPGVLQVLLAQGYAVFGHDRSFADAEKAAAFERETPGMRALAAQTADDLYAEVVAIGEMDAFVFNDVYPNTPQDIEQIPAAIMQATFEAVLLFPFRLSQLFLPALKRRRQGSIVFVTSARPLRPESGFAAATTLRAATTAFAQALAKEAAPYQIQVNAVAPNYLYSEMYYPRTQFIDDPAGRAAIAALVPLGRLGRPEELGELVAFLVSGRSSFTTGQVIYFTGGWP